MFFVENVETMWHDCSLKGLVNKTCKKCSLNKVCGFFGSGGVDNNVKCWHVQHGCDNSVESFKVVDVGEVTQALYDTFDNAS